MRALLRNGLLLRFTVADVDPATNSVRKFISAELQAVDITGSYTEAYNEAGCPRTSAITVRGIGYLDRFRPPRQHRHDARGYSFGEQRRHGIPDLSELLATRPGESHAVREGL